MKNKIQFKIIFLLSTILFFINSAYSEDQSDRDILTLKDSILIAFNNNKDIQIQEQELKVSTANILGARSEFLPHVNLDGAYTHNDKVFAQNIFTGYNNDNKISLFAIESVYSGGKNLANLRQSQLNLKASEETLRAKKLDIEFEAKRLYFGLLLAYESARIAREAFDQAIAHYKDVEKMFNQGVSSRFDLLQSKVQVSLLEPEVVKSKNDIDSLKAELNKLLSRDVNTLIKINEKLECSFIDIKEHEFLKAAYLDKPEMRLKSLGIDIDKWSIEMAKSGYRPQIDLGAGYTYRSNNLGNILENKYKNWSAGVSVSIPVFEGFSTKAKVDAARARYTQAKLDKDNLADQISVDIRNSCLNLKEAEAIIQSQKDNVSVAAEALRIAEVSYANGVVTNLDVLDAQVSLAQIQKNLAESIYDYLMAQAYLDRNMAKSVIKEDNNEKKS